MVKDDMKGKPGRPSVVQPEEESWRCPTCNLKRMRIRADRLYKCKACREVATLKELRDYAESLKPKKEKTQSGSGVIAGRIVHGRGAFWGAGY
jgi:ribosomal protein L37AE/L43A